MAKWSTKSDEPRGWRKGRDQKPEHHHHAGRGIRTILEAVSLILELQETIMALSQRLTDALAAQDEKIATNDRKVDEFIASHQGTSAADEQAVVDRLSAQGQALDATAAKLTPPA